MHADILPTSLYNDVLQILVMQKSKISGCCCPVVMCAGKVSHLHDLGPCFGVVTLGTFVKFSAYGNFLLFFSGLGITHTTVIYT